MGMPVIKFRDIATHELLQVSMALITYFIARSE